MKFSPRMIRLRFILMAILTILIVSISFVASDLKSRAAGMSVSLGFDVACDLSTTTPWNDITQDNLFTLQTTAGSALDTSGQCMSSVNVPQWVANVHANHRLALITIGGIADQNWQTACNDTYRSAFVTNLVNYMKSNGFDGIDLDIEDDTWAAIIPPVAPWDTCVQTIANVAHATTTAAGARPIISEDVTTNWMGAYVKNDVPYVDQFNLMTYGDSCGNNCSSFASDIQTTYNQGIPKAKMVLGIDLIDDTPQHSNQTLDTTSNALSSGSPITSIPVSALASAIPAGNIVLDTSENPPAHYQVFATTGAAAGATSIPVSSQTPNYAYPSGSYIQNDYKGQWDCGNIANYSLQGLMGTMGWDIHEDAVLHNGSFPCFDQIGQYIGASIPTPTPTQTPTPTPQDPSPTPTPTLTLTPKPQDPIQTPGTGSLTFINSADAKGNFGGGVSITIPAGVQPGDLLIAAAGTNGTPAAWTTPTGWNKGAGSGTTQSQGLNWFWKIANGTEGGTKVKLKASVYSDGGGIIAVYRGESSASAIAGVSSLATNVYWDSSKGMSAKVNGVSLAGTTSVVPLILTSWQSGNATISWPSGFVDKAGATDGYGHVEIGEILSSVSTNNLSSQTLNFSAAQAVTQTLQIAVRVGQ